MSQDKTAAKANKSYYLFHMVYPFIFQEYFISKISLINVKVIVLTRILAK
ncbi:hypothetical protein MGWOODY_Mmi910 [hydrothermal vent metagenome]|uniref:Uncharacterized protein n=1 Tax=hydrothermal vent metagenome TaxID=652676 RepID=A0A161JVX3_9ZZZZ